VRRCARAGMRVVRPSQARAELAEFEVPVAV
jgi:hypothetical protein